VLVEHFFHEALFKEVRLFQISESIPNVEETQNLETLILLGLPHESF
jgi:hypothetical protein